MQLELLIVFTGSREETMSFLNESLSSRLWKTHMAFCSRIELDVLFNSNPKFLFSRLSAPAIVDTYAYAHTAPPQIFAAKDV